MSFAGLEGRLPYNMTYPEPWRGPPKPPPEFLRPKPVVPTSRYNGVNTSPNGTRLAAQRPIVGKYPSPGSIPSPSPVNLTQHKQDDIPEELSPYIYRQQYQHQAHFTPYPPMHSLYPAPYLLSNYAGGLSIPNTSFSPTAAVTSSTFLSPPSTFSPPSPVKAGQSIIRGGTMVSHHQILSQSQKQETVAFKVPSGKEGSLKHRILNNTTTRPDDGRSTNLCLSTSSSGGGASPRTIPAPLDLQKPVEIARKRLNAATLSPPRSPHRKVVPNNNNVVPGNFAKGSLIQLANGELRKIEDLKTDDFVSSAENSSDLRLTDSTVCRIEENDSTGTATITLSYNQRRTQVDIESPLGHPFFVFGQGWASCRPDRTQEFYSLKVYRLQVGDIIISLTPRERFVPPAGRTTSTIMTTATGTAMTSRPAATVDVVSKVQTRPINLMHSAAAGRPLSPESLAARKRRWSAPDQICDEEEQYVAARQRQRID